MKSEDTSLLYGNGLSLGDGWTWTFDVTDYRSLLADSVHLYAGNWQELLDLKFVMIKGIPPRDVISIQNLWNGSYEYGKDYNPKENHLTPKKVLIPANAHTAKWNQELQDTAWILPPIALNSVPIPLL